MADHPSFVQGIVVEEAYEFTLLQLSQACQVRSEQLVALVDEGVLQPQGAAPDEWRFGGPSLRRARAALRLAHDLELNVSGTAVVIELLDQIEALRSRLRRTGA